MKKLLLLVLTVTLVGCLQEAEQPPEPGDGGNTPAGNLVVSRDMMVFNAGGTIESDSRTLRVSNDGAGTLSASLAVTGADAARFTLSEAGPFSLAAGEGLGVTVTFTPGADLGPQEAVLRVTTDGTEDAEVDLGGLSVVGQEGTNEPSVQWIFDTYGFAIQTGDPDPTTSALADEVTNELVGDEVRAQTFRRADPTQPATAEVLAAFGVPNVEPVFEFGYYEAGTAEPSLQELLSIPVNPDLNGQRLQPVIVPAAPEVAEGVVSFSPPETFGFYSFWPTTRFFKERTVYTEDVLNDFPNATPHHVRTFPLKLRNGVRVENAYVLITDESNRLNDFNDAVILVRNVQPVAAGQ